MKKYIDCDGVILDTENGLFDEYYKLKEHNPNLQKLQYLQEMDWDSWLQRTRILGNSIDILKQYDPKTISILTKVFSLREATAKIEFFRRAQLKNDIIIVPNDIAKSQMVDAKGNILIDDSNKNLEDWENAGGISMYFGEGKSRFYRVSSIDSILDNTRLLGILNDIDDARCDR